jgi:hypothetical protein
MRDFSWKTLFAWIWLGAVFGLLVGLFALSVTWDHLRFVLVISGIAAFLLVTVWSIENL